MTVFAVSSELVALLTSLVGCICDFISVLQLCDMEEICVQEHMLRFVLVHVSVCLEGEKRFCI